MANAPVFGKLLSALGIRESVALTDVDLSRAVPVIELSTVIRGRQVDTRFMSIEVSHVGAGAITVDVDPRRAADFDRVLLNGTSLDPSLSPGTAVPDDHDYLIMGIAFRRSTSTVKCTVIMGANTSIFKQVLAHAEDTDATLTVYNKAGGMYNYPMPFFSQAGANFVPGFFSDAAAALDARCILHVISGPQGLLGP